MPTLIVDTCLHGCTAIVAENGAAIAATSELIGVGHAERLAPMVSDVIEQSGVGAAHISRVAATVGPGSFMGVRVGISFAKGFAAARSLPTAPISTLEALRLSSPGKVELVAVDARRDQLYVQRFGSHKTGPMLMNLDGARASFSSLAPAAVIGSGVSLLFEGAHCDLVVPTVEGLIAAAVTTSDGPLVPLYLREPDAKPPTRR